MNDIDLHHLRRCVDLAEEAVEAGDQLFGTIFVSGEGEVLFEDRNRTGTGDPTLHPEFAIARWAAWNLPAAQRRSATVYTSGEHCTMCAAAHAFVGLGRIVYASSSEQLAAWSPEIGRPASPIRCLPIASVILDANVAGPAPELADRIRALHVRAQRRADK